MDDAWQADAPPAVDERARSRSPERRDDREDRRDYDRRGGGGRGGDRGGDRNDPGQHNPGNNLHVSGLSRSVTTALLEEHFGAIGRVAKASVMLDPHTRDSRGFGFVTMETPEEAEAVVKALSGTEWMGRTMNVEKARRGRARTPTPGKYFGPPKREGRDGPGERPYEPRPYYPRRDGPPRGGRDYERGGRDYDRGDRYDRDSRRRDDDRGRYGGGGSSRGEYGGRERDGGGSTSGRDYDRAAF